MKNNEKKWKLEYLESLPQVSNEQIDGNEISEESP